MLCKLSKKCLKRYMNRLILCITLLLTCFYAWSNTHCNSIDEISWIVGDWQQTTSSKDNSKIAHENWQRVSEDTLEGVGFTLDKNTKIVFQESLRIVVMQERLFLLAKINENELPVAFKAKECSKNSVLFENLAHDFPQQLHYLQVENSLKVKVSDTEGKGFTLLYSRVQGTNR